MSKKPICKWESICDDDCRRPYGNCPNNCQNYKPYVSIEELEKENAELKEQNKTILEDNDTLNKWVDELRAQIEKMKNFIFKEIDFCFYCPLTDTCINDEGTCPYANITEEEQKNLLSEWITK